jgi:hypothetical protein
MNESVTELKRLHLLSKPELKQALINIKKIIKNDDGEAALFAIEHLSDAIKSHDHVEDILFAEVDRLLKVEADYKALQEIMDRARKLAFQSQEVEEERPRFKMDSEGNLTRIDY